MGDSLGQDTLVLPSSIEPYYFAVLSVRDEASRLRSTADYSGASLLLLSVLHDALERVAADFANLSHDSEAQRRKAARYQEVAGRLHEALGFLQGSDEDSAPSSLVQPLETLAQRYQRGCRLLVRGSFEGGPGAYWCELFVPGLIGLLNGLSDGPALADRLRGLVGLVFPSAERENALMHAVLGHELGHGFLFQQPLADQIKVPTEKYVDSLLAGEKTLFIRQDTTTAFGALVDIWLEEVLADAWGLHLIGPAYYFASSREIEEAPPSLTHPAGHVRLQFLLTQLHRRGYSRRAGPLGDWLREYLQKESHRHQDLAKRVQSNPFFDAGHGALKGVEDDIFSAVESQRRRIAFRPARLEKVACFLTDRLCNLVPPNDMDGTRVNLPDVLNAGWLVWHQHWDRFCDALDAKTSEDRFLARSKLNRLLLKALEYSAIETHWRGR